MKLTFPFIILCLYISYYKISCANNNPKTTKKGVSKTTTKRITSTKVVSITTTNAIPITTTSRKTTAKPTTKNLISTTNKISSTKKQTKNLISTTNKISSTKKQTNATRALNFTSNVSRKPPRQDDMNTGLGEILKRRERERLPKNRTRDRARSKSNMRQTSDLAKTLNDVTIYSFNFVSESISKRDLTDSIIVESTYCPFKNVSCDSSYKYRSYDGSCNNLNTPLYGAANTPYKRIFSPDYDDDFNSARTLALSGKELPNPRIVSLAISPPITFQLLEVQITHLYPIFGQFLTHDISGTSATTDSNGDEIDCPCGSTDESCLPVTWPSNDKFLNQTCMKFTRSSATFPDFTCTISYREQLNLLSSFIDGSGIYGIDEERSKDLRTFSNGLLKTSSGIPATSQGITGRTYLPLSNDNCSTDGSSQFKCFYAGEYRTSENLGLVSMHTLFNREHNRIATELLKLNPKWSDETLYQETRRIVIGIFQHIVYNEWLPMVSGNSSLKPLTNNEYYNGYDENLNPALSNEFSTAAFRFGHSLIRDKMGNYNVSQTRFKSFDFPSIVFKSDLAYNTNSQGLNSIFNGLLNDMCWKFGSFGFQMQNNLFAQTEKNVSSAVDLLATNIQRGRDHGLQPYVKYVKKCHNIEVTVFNDLLPLIAPPNLAVLQTVYENVNDIDLYVGGLAEKKLSNLTLTGSTFGCLVIEQFSDLKNGDRFYYENGPSINSNAFSLSQLAEIKKVTLSGLICNNYDLTSIQPNPFFNPSTNNLRVSCESLKSQIDFSLWMNSE